MPALDEAGELVGILDQFLERAGASTQKRAQAKLIKKYKAAIAKRFKAQRDWFLAHALPPLKPRFAESSLREADDSDDVLAQSISALLDEWLDDPEVVKDLDQLIKLATAAGVDSLELQIPAEDLAAALAKLLGKRGSQDIQFGLDNPKAIKYLEEHAFDVVSKLIDDTTQARLKNILLDGLTNKQGYDKIASSIRAEFIDMSRSRAVTIATYEIGNAYSQGTLAAAADLKDAGFEMEKAWQTVGDDLVSDDCQENQDAGWIGLEDDFPSGDDAPLAHPNCRCTLLTRKVRAEELVAA